MYIQCTDYIGEPLHDGALADAHAQRVGLDTRQRGVQSEGGAVDGGSII